MVETPKKAKVSFAIWLLVIAMVGGLMVTYNYSLIRAERAKNNRNMLPMEQLPEFSLLDQDGNPFTRDTMMGRVWLLNCIYTRCPGPCEKLSGEMRELQKKLQDMPDVAIASLSVDPVNDSPPVLKEYSKRFAANPEQWKFLTGEQSAMLDFIIKELKLPVTDMTPERVEEEGIFLHSTRIVLVDKNAILIGYYDSKSPAAMEKLLGDVKHFRKRSQVKP